MKNKQFTIFVSVAVALIILLGVGAVLLLNRGGDTDPSASMSQSLSQSSMKASESTKPTEKPRPSEILEEYKAQKQENPDMVGWIKLENSRINYPIMHTPNDPIFYERHNFAKAYDIYGLPFLDAGVNLDSHHYLLWGHETDNGSQFHDFLKYQDKNFWENNKTFTFSDLYETYTYEVVAFGKYNIEDVDSPNFKFYKYYDFKDEAEFNEYMSNIKKGQSYDTGITPKFGDHLISAAMCIYPVTSEEQPEHWQRYVMVARRVEK